MRFFFCSVLILLFHASYSFTTNRPIPFLPILLNLARKHTLRSIDLFLQVLQPKQNLLILSADRQAIKLITMKKIFFFTAITFSTLSSCQKEATTLAKDQTSVQSQTQTLAKNHQQPILSTASSDGAAVPFHGSFDESLDGIQLYNSCTNEQMTLYGSAHDVFHGFYNGPDSKTTFHYDLGTVSAVGESGREYIVTGTLNAQEGEFSVGEFTFKFINKYRFITKDGGSNFFYELTHYFKVDAEGNFIVIRAEVEKTYCR